MSLKYIKAYGGSQIRSKESLNHGVNIPKYARENPKLDTYHHQILLPYYTYQFTFEPLDFMVSHIVCSWWERKISGRCICCYAGVE